MKGYIWFIRYRLELSFVFFALAVWVNLSAGFWQAFALYFLFLLLVVTHFMFGPLRVVQQYMEDGQLAKAEKTLNAIWFPRLLYKPIRAVYFTVKGAIAMANKDFDNAEKHMQQSIDIGLPMKEAEGANKLQLGMLMLQKGDLRKGESLLKQALKDGVQDTDAKAMALLQLSSLSVNKREFRQAREYFRRAKLLKSTNQEVVSQIKQMERHVSRLPG